MTRQSASLWLVVLWLVVLWYKHYPPRCLAAGVMIYRDAASLVDAARPAVGSSVRSVALVVVAAASA